MDICAAGQAATGGRDRRRIEPLIGRESLEIGLVGQEVVENRAEKARIGRDSPDLSGLDPGQRQKPVEAGCVGGDPSERRNGDVFGVGGRWFTN